ncbi:MULTISPECIES: MarR family transcriptional regulator [Actinoplanes]|uniref:MarR family winged helix-turn-helix transcriptional regulator n=1 Tax=Actinoplanes TaxID=1865 RepID=UPI0005F2D182|nr:MULTISPECIES: MarR family transcriptional regulator [Actinoplanes]GLY02822.1 ranscriptional regulator [Actinoplanes sp. NBRC 101535]
MHSPSIDSEVTWLLHRAAQRMRCASGEQAEKHGLALRDYIVLNALSKTPGLTQGELGKSLGLDKTTLMSQLDGLERRGLVVRHNDPRDRRLRIPVITEDGEALRTTVAAACVTVEADLLGAFTADEAQSLRHMLVTIIGATPDRGSCL